NLLIDVGGRPKIDGFSFAVHESQTSARSGLIVGTPAYMAPEQFAGEAQHLGAHTDVLALGIILYEALVCKCPISASNIDELFHTIRKVDALELREVDPSIPEELQTICLKCLRKNPQDRYPSAAAFRDELRRWLIAQDLALSSTQPLVF